jgi:hypothetical protein
MTPTVVFGIPSGAHAPKMGFWESSLAAQSLLSERGINQVWLAAGGDPYLAKVRNNLVSRALTRFPDLTHFFFIDDDVSFPAQAVIDLIEAPHDVCAGVYPKKTDMPDYPCNLYHDPVTMRPVEKDGWHKAQSVPTGFLCIKAHVLKEQAKTAPRYRDLDGSICWNIFEMGFCKEPQPDGLEGQWWGEDPAWCRKYIENGGDIWVKADIEFGHTGTKTWRGNFADRVKISAEGTIAWGPDGRMAFFADPADVPADWTTTKPEPQPLAAD